MAVKMGQRLAVMLLTALVCGIVLAVPAPSQEGDDPAALSAEAEGLFRAGKYAEAIEIAKRLLAIREKTLGPDHPDLARSLDFLAGLYRTQGPFGAAEPLYRRSLAIHEKALGSEHPNLVRA